MVENRNIPKRRNRENNRIPNSLTPPSILQPRKRLPPQPRILLQLLHRRRRNRLRPRKFQRVLSSQHARLRRRRQVPLIRRRQLRHAGLEIRNKAIEHGMVRRCSQGPLRQLDGEEVAHAPVGVGVGVVVGFDAEEEAGELGGGFEGLCGGGAVFLVGFGVGPGGHVAVFEPGGGGAEGVRVDVAVLVGDGLALSGGCVLREGCLEGLTMPPMLFATTTLKTSDLSTGKGNAFSVSTRSGTASVKSWSQPSSSQRKYAMFPFPSATAYSSHRSTPYTRSGAHSSILVFIHVWCTIKGMAE